MNVEPDDDANPLRVLLALSLFCALDFFERASKKRPKVAGAWSWCSFKALSAQKRRHELGLRFGRIAWDGSAAAADVSPSWLVQESFTGYLGFVRRATRRSALRTS